MKRYLSKFLESKKLLKEHAMTYNTISEIKGKCDKLMSGIKSLENDFEDQDWGYYESELKKINEKFNSLIDGLNVGGNEQ